VSEVGYNIRHKTDRCLKVSDCRVDQGDTSCDWLDNSEFKDVPETLKQKPNIPFKNKIELFKNKECLEREKGESETLRDGAEWLSGEYESRPVKLVQKEGGMSPSIEENQVDVLLNESGDEMIYIGDLSRPYSLPCIQGARNEDLKSISPQTVRSLPIYVSFLEIIRTAF